MKRSQPRRGVLLPPRFDEPPRQVGGLAVFLGAGVGAGFRRDAALLDGGIVDHGEFGGAQAFDFVAEAGGFLEIEVGGGFAHPGFEIAEHGFEIVPDR